MNPHIFREYDIRGVAGKDLTEESVYDLARAFGTFFVGNGVMAVSLGRDGRESSPRFGRLMAQGLNECGCDVIDVGMVPTPVVYYTLFQCGVGGGVMITGSHNPADNNGFKICLGKSTIFGGQISAIKELAFARKFATGTGTLKQMEIVPAYSQHIAENVKLGPRRLKVIVDGGNGMGGWVGAPLYRTLGCDVVELFCEPDSRFPNHHPDPTVVENVQSAIDAVAAHRADLAIAFDGDGDRIGVIDELGRIIWGDQLMVLFSRSILKEEPGATFIAEVKCSQTLFDDIRRHGGNPIMWKVGHSLIKAKMKESGAVLAGEMSGHMFFADRYFGYDDAIYAGARLLEILSHFDGPLSALLADLPPTVYTPEIRVECPDERKFQVVEAVKSHFQKIAEVVDVDGARVLFQHGWGLVRASNTQPILVLRFEADSTANLNQIREIVETKVRETIQS
jgi:phosphomannomutase/phosphoglucomutase